MLIGLPIEKLEFVALARSAIASPGGEAVERSETDEERRNRAIFHAVRKKVRFEKLYVLICLRPISENVAIPHPPLRGTFPSGEGIGPPIYNFTISLLKPIACYEMTLVKR